MEKTKNRTKEIKTVERTITLKIPERFDKQLEALADALHRTVESVLKEQLYATMGNWYSGGFAEGWAHDIWDWNGLGKELEEEVVVIAEAEGC